MLFRRNNYSSQFYLLGLNPYEEEEITKLITENGGEISRIWDAPAIAVSTTESYCQLGKPLFHINFVRECVRRNKVLDLLDFIIGSKGYYGCLETNLIYGKNFCQLHSPNTFDILSPSLSTQQIGNSYGRVSETTKRSRTHTEDSCPYGDSLVTQERVEERPYKSRRVTKVLLSKSSHSPTHSDFLPSQSARDESFSFLERPQDRKMPVPEFPQGMGESPQDGEPCDAKSKNQRNTNIVDDTAKNTKTPSEMTDHDTISVTSQIIDLTVAEELVKAPKDDDKIVRNMAVISTELYGTNNKAKKRASEMGVEVSKCVKAVQGVKKEFSSNPFIRNIQRSEQKAMITYLIKHNCISEGKGLDVWKKVIAEKKVRRRRTPQSLNTNFRKAILPNLHRFQLSPGHLKQFEKLKVTKNNNKRKRH